MEVRNHEFWMVDCRPDKILTLQSVFVSCKICGLYMQQAINSRVVIKDLKKLLNVSTKGDWQG